MADLIPATFGIPQETSAPIEIEFRHEALYMAVVDRDQWSSEVSKEWQRPGIYLLFGPPSDDAPGRFSVYVGKAAPGTIHGRISAHVKNKESWDRALLLRRTASSGFTSTDIGWLEGEIHRALIDSPFAEVLNSVTPGDETLSKWDRESLSRVVTLVESVLRVLGYRSKAAGAQPTESDSTVGKPPQQTDVFTTETAHQVISLVREGEWTTYGDIAAVLGSHPNGIGSHIRNCKVADGTPEWRVLNRRGESSPGFIWTTSSHQGTQLDVLAQEGVPIVDDTRADPSVRVESSELGERLIRSSAPHT